MPFFKLKDAVNEVSDAVGAKDASIAGAKLVGKALFNIGKFAIEGLDKQVESKSSELLKLENISDEQKERLQEINRGARERNIRRSIKEIEYKILELERALDTLESGSEESQTAADELRYLEREKSNLEEDLDKI